MPWLLYRGVHVHIYRPFHLLFVSPRPHLRWNFTARLGIPADRLPDLACLIGNDWIQPGDRVHG